jgi:hypothetical protein
LKLCFRINSSIHRLVKTYGASLSLMLLLCCAGCYIDEPGVPVQPPSITRLDSNTYQITVDARAPWVATGIEVKSGQRIRFSAEGTWGESPGVDRSADGGSAGIFGSGYWGVERRVPSAPWGALVGRVGIDKFLIGQSAILTMSQDGELMLGINDGDDNLWDNHGYMTVTVHLL